MAFVSLFKSGFQIVFPLKIFIYLLKQKYIKFLGYNCNIIEINLNGD